MSKLLRYYSSGQSYFITAVTHSRDPILIENSDLMREAMACAKTFGNLEILAWVILPDHFHAVLRPENGDLASTMQRLKLSFSSRYRKRMNLRYGQIWQRRFWDHTIRNADDLQRHLDYIHYNPVKHGLIECPFEWTESSACEFLRRGNYSSDWGRDDLFMDADGFGE
jgi:putative transposase